MKTQIHPQYQNDALISCACGNSFTAGSTQKEIKVDICSNCHPFYTGEQRFVDTQGRVEKFQARMKASEGFRGETRKKSSAGADVFVAPKSLKEMLSAKK